MKDFKNERKSKNASGHGSSATESSSFLPSCSAFFELPADRRLVLVQQSINEKEIKHTSIESLKSYTVHKNNYF